MLVLNHGIDLVDCNRIGRLVARHGQRFLERVFTKTELEYANSGRNRLERLAGRFAAKEAVLKLIGTGWSTGTCWTEIEVVNDPMGRPLVRLAGRVQQIALQKGIQQVQISITHAANLAIASAVALAEAHGQQ
ncbi:MAG: holo-ACP synthase [Sedimentisphaerales bacterium]|jgi:holo-[acyl-carrier protein] synthase|nr:holo-ACP synthase [Sedimentisphaerales bacterium]